MFSFEYYKMVRIIPFVLDEKPLLQSIVKENSVQFWVLIVLNTIDAVLIGVSLYFCYVSENCPAFYIIYMATCLLGFISGIYLGLSIFRIRKLTKERKLEINTKIMIVHISTFILFLVISVVYDLPFGLQKSKEFKHATNLFYNFCSCITQVIICYIFWNMDQIQFVPVPAA